MHSTVVAVCFTLACGQSAALSPKEIQDGWLRLFDGETTFGWSTKGDVQVGKDALTLAGGKVGAEMRSTTEFGFFEAELTYRVDNSNKSPVIELLSKLELAGGERQSKWQTAHFRYHRDEAKNQVVVEAEIPRDKGAALASMRVTTVPAPRVPFVFHVPPGSRLLIQSLKLKTLDMKLLFNGKDLSGWKVFPGRKSDFTVTDQGEINVRNGPGDLQTEGKYGNFVLQLECKSNGKHLNSGIFFRCRDIEYQNGYEAQIRNEFKPEPTQEYVLEEYDPETNKLLAKKKMKYTAVDFGTGAIYRRQPARKEASKDGEWFTLTVVAHANHFATWVNGLQVADWTDHRPKSDNARTGCRLQPGHISIQGHDPTTDLSFRNLRIADWK
ncbi:MAG: DUF1080 domain-containing protein [Gemmataceae bacterium]|nr:DUF1080 domain-containing protein [Gemmataceae bacterium]MCI0740266.1 DUF1080 domain-containing protein [Gemmataceae bacterium]